MMRSLIDYKRGIILGFIFGSIIAPAIAVFGLISPFIENMRPVLVGPMDFIASFIPNTQIGPDTYYAPMYKWILVHGFNGIIYAIAGGLLQNILRRRKT